MDDHLFFAWLEETPWREAVGDRLTGNWIPYFNQMQMYRPVSGLVQVVNYQLLETGWFAHHVFNFLLHVLTSYMAGNLAYRLTHKTAAGWFTSGLLLLHPRAALGVSLIFNFCDLLAAALMMLSLHCLGALKDSGPVHSSWKYLGLWGGAVLALGTKEVALPLVLVLILADLLWKDSAFEFKRFCFRHGFPVGALAAYVLARTYFIGHPFHTHSHPAAFALPENAELWAFFWDGLLLGTCSLGAVIVQQSAWLKSALPAKSGWMLLWCGLMLWPAVHFCSEVTLRPWFFDERYWYVPLVPLTVFAGSLLAHGTALSSLLGAGIVGLTVASPAGLMMALALFLASGPLRLLSVNQEVQNSVHTLFAAAFAVLIWAKCAEVRTRADEAERVHRQIGRVVREAPQNVPLVLLHFTEETVEPHQSFNGNLQWLLKPPFFPEDLNQRFFFAYPTWDAPPTNRYRDRTTAELQHQLSLSHKPLHVYFWDAERDVLSFVGVRSGKGQEVLPVEDPLGALGHRPDESVPGPIWSAKGLDIDPRVFGFLRFELVSENVLKVSVNPRMTIGWLAESSSFEHEEKLDLSLTELATLCPPPAKITLTFPVQNYVDWLMSGRITGLSVTVSDGLRVVSVECLSRLPDDVTGRTPALTHYLHPEKQFVQTGHSWLSFKR